MISSAGTGYPYPIPWHLVPINIYVAIHFIRKYIFGPTSKLVNKARADHGIKHDRFDLSLPPIATICLSLPEPDFDWNWPNPVARQTSDGSGQRAWRLVEPASYNSRQSWDAFHQHCCVSISNCKSTRYHPLREQRVTSPLESQVLLPRKHGSHLCSQAVPRQ
jgi:hypothetical protein